MLRSEPSWLGLPAEGYVATAAPKTTSAGCSMPVTILATSTTRKTAPSTLDAPHDPCPKPAAFSLDNDAMDTLRASERPKSCQPLDGSAR